MAILNAYLVPKYDYDTADFGEGDGYFVGLEVAKFLKESVDGVAEFSGVDFWWDAAATSVGPRDLVCYVLGDISQSIVIKHSASKTLPSTAGNTVWSTKLQRMISEVYLDGAMNFAADLQQRDRVLAISIIHEFMHNKLDKYPHKKGATGYVTDIHTTQGKAASQGITYAGGFYDAEDVKLMKAGIAHKVPQYTAAM